MQSSEKKLQRGLHFSLMWHCITGQYISPSWVENSTLEDDKNTMSQYVSHKSPSDAATHLSRTVTSTALPQKPKNSQPAKSFKFINTNGES